RANVRHGLVLHRRMRLWPRRPYLTAARLTREPCDRRGPARLGVHADSPEHVAKMNFSLNAVDEQLRLGDDRESVGIILCTDRNETVAKLALHRVYAPIAVSTWKAGTPPPELPAVEITDEVPADLGDLSELDTVRTR